MAKLTKAQQRAHENACALLASDAVLREDQIVDVIENWHEGAMHANTRASAHFTPWDLAFHAALEVGGPRVLDLCAGIGTLACAVNCKAKPGAVSLTLVEINPDYAAVAGRLLPEAEVIVGSMYDAGLMAELASRRFDTCVSNPPFGTFSKAHGARAPRYAGGEAHYDCIDIASDVADAGVFILPQQAVPFRYSGRRNYETVPRGANPRYDRFTDQTGIVLDANLGIDTTTLAGFRDVTLTTEIATVDFVEARRVRAARETPLLGMLAA